jgi:hypothetical protein
MKRKKMMSLFAALLIASIVAGYLSIQNPGVLNSAAVFQSEKFQEDGLKFHSKDVTVLKLIVKKLREVAQF